MATIKLVLAYDGTQYAGWQFQPLLPTIQGEVERAVQAVTGEPLRVYGASRTDAGVHALGQVATFRTETRITAAQFHRALNTKLPDDIRVVTTAEAADDFDPQRMAVFKRYRYVLDDGPIVDVHRRQFAWHMRGRLDVATMHEAAQQLVGTHDFASFQSGGSPRNSTVRTIYSLTVRRDETAPHVVTLEVTGNGFLYNMVRTITGTLVRVGHHRRPAEWVAQALAAQTRRAAGPTAPPQGLFLVAVEYDSESGSWKSEIGVRKSEIRSQNSDFKSPSLPACD